MRLVVTGGGTGGHVYPALAVLESLGAIGENSLHKEGRTEVLFVGTRGGLEEQIVGEYSIPFAGIKAGAIRGKSPFETMGNIAKMFQGVFQALSVISKFNPEAVLATGGYVCAPVAVAAGMKRIPILVFLPDVKPGWAVRFISLFARKIAVTNKASLDFLPKNKTVVTGYPVRHGIGKVDKRKARAGLSLDTELKTLLVLGGSRGAHSINRAIGDTIEHLTEFCQIVHASGPEDEPMLRATCEKIKRKERYRLFKYLDKNLLPLALDAADLVVSRSGASTMGEFPAAGLPSILIPYPYAGAHQELNADVLVESGSAVKLPNSKLDLLSGEIERLITDDHRLFEMSGKARAMSRPDAASSIAGELEKLCVSLPHTPD